MSMTGRVTSSDSDTKCKGMGRTGSPASMSTGSWPSDAFDASAAVAAVGLTVKPVGKPDAGNPHVRFDERGWETERCRMAQATAPILDSTNQGQEAPSSRRHKGAAATRPGSWGRQPGSRRRGPPGDGDAVRPAPLPPEILCRRRLSAAGVPSRHGPDLPEHPGRDCQAIRPGKRLRGPAQSWIVERTIAWLNRCRRLAKDWECLNRKGLAFLHLASIQLILRKLCNPSK